MTIFVDSYIDRNNLLKELGYESYKDYLNSRVWKEIRRRVYASYRGRCYFCKTHASAIHHLGYNREVLVGELIEALVPLCDSCHNKVEFGKDGGKNSLLKVRLLFKRLSNELGIKLPKCIAQLSNKEKRRRKEERRIRKLEKTRLERERDKEAIQQVRIKFELEFNLSLSTEVTLRQAKKIFNKYQIASRTKRKELLNSAYRKILNPLLS